VELVNIARKAVKNARAAFCG